MVAAGIFYSKVSHWVADLLVSSCRTVREPGRWYRKYHRCRPTWTPTGKICPRPSRQTSSLRRSVVRNKIYFDSYKIIYFSNKLKVYNLSWVKLKGAVYHLDYFVPISNLFHFTLFWNLFEIARLYTQIFEFNQFYSNSRNLFNFSNLFEFIPNCYKSFELILIYLNLSVLIRTSQIY